MLSLEFEGIVMPAVGLLNNGEVLYRQTNGRLTTERHFDGTKDTHDFITLDVDFQTEALPDDFEGCDFDADVEAMVFNGEDMIPVTKNIIKHKCSLPDDICYNLYGKYPITASDIVHVDDAKEKIMFKSGDKVICQFHDDNRSDEQLANVWNSVQGAEEYNYISFIELLDDLLIPTMVHKVEDDEYEDYYEDYEEGDVYL